MWLCCPFFQPVMRSTEKTIIGSPAQPHRVRRRYGPAQTPLRRLCATNAISTEKRQRPKRRRDQTNPRRLRQDIYELLDHLLCLPGAKPDQAENALETLFTRLPT